MRKRLFQKLKFGIVKNPSHLLVDPPPGDEPLPPLVQFLLDGGEADGADFAAVINRGLSRQKKCWLGSRGVRASRGNTCSFQRAMSPGIGGKNMSVTYFSSWVSSSELRSCFPSNTWQIMFEKSSRTTFATLFIPLTLNAYGGNMLQCLAVRTQRLLIREPPQKNLHLPPSLACSITCHGN